MISRSYYCCDHLQRQGERRTLGASLLRTQKLAKSFNSFSSFAYSFLEVEPPQGGFARETRALTVAEGSLILLAS